MNRDRAMEIIGKMIRLSDADAVTAGVGRGIFQSIRLADNVFTQNVASDDSSIWVECAYGRSHGGASTNNLGDDSLKALVKRAQDIARVSPPDPEYMPPLKPKEAGKYPVINAFANRTLELDPKEKARELADAVKKVRACKLRLSGGYSTGGWYSAFGNSVGLRAWHRSTNAEAHMTVLGGAGSGWAQEISSDSGKIDAVRVATEAADIAAKARNPVSLPAGKYDVIMRPAAAAELLIFMFFGGFDAKSCDEGRSFLRGKLGKKVFGGNITLRTDPIEPKCPGAPYLGDGLAARPMDWVRNGMIANLIYSRFWAKKKHKAPTGWPTNIIMDGGNESVDRMIAGTENGLLITRFWYIRDVDPMIPSVTGMSRDGLFEIRNGKVGRAVRHMRFNENLVDLFSRVEALGVPERTGEYSAMLVPAIKVRGFNFTSTTKF